MLENMTPPKPLPKVKDKQATITVEDSSYTGKVIDINQTFVMVEIEDGGYVILPWGRIVDVTVPANQ